MKVLLSDGETYLDIIGEFDGEGLDAEAFGVGDVKFPTLSESLQPITLFCEEALTILRKSTNPDELNIEFGIEAGGEAGVFGLAKSNLKATISVRAKWVKTSH